MTTDAGTGAAAPETPAAAPAAPAAGNPTHAAPAPGSAAPNAPAAPAAAPEAPKTPGTGTPSPETSTTNSDGSAKPTAPDGQPPLPSSFKIPDEYKDKPWAAKVTSEAELWKQLANTQELIGKKSIVPDLKTATPEQKEEFYKQMRPADPSAYKFTGDMASPDTKAAVGKMFMDNGISEVQGNAIIEQYTAMGEAAQAQMYDPEQFKETMKAQFGDDWEKVTGTSYNNLKAMMSDQDQKLMEHMPNAYAGLIYRTLGNTDKAVQTMMQRYGVKETSLAHFAGSPASAGGGDINAARADLRGQMGRLAAGPHTADQMQDLRTKLAKTYENDPRIQK